MTPSVAGDCSIDCTVQDLEILKKTLAHMVAAREMDQLEESYTGRGDAFFTLSGAGHEAIAALNPHLGPQDWLHCHYRDKALMLARGISIRSFFDSFFCRDASYSRGRQMPPFLSDRSHNILSQNIPTGNNALQAVGVALQVKDLTGRPIVYCGDGDGTTQQGEFLEAVAAAVRDTLPVLFVVENNRYAISTSTSGRTFFSYPEGEADSFYGIPIRRVNGWDVVGCYHTFGAVVQQIREKRGPAIVVMNVERLANHTNADDQRIYRSEDELERNRREFDPIVTLGHYLIEKGGSQELLTSQRENLKTEIALVADQAHRGSNPAPAIDPKKPLPAEMKQVGWVYEGSAGGDRLTMIEAIREVLRHQLATNSEISLYGEDLEDPKGDVFGVTRGLSTAFPGRVRNSPLAESSIVGLSIGRALAGGRPVCFLQFADFIPITFNQIASELGSMYWRTDGTWECPVILMITCGAYRPGLGPFHAQTFESIAAHTPGVDVFMPSTAPDAAGLLNAAFESGRPTLFFYPKSCLNDREATTSSDVNRQRLLPGTARLVRTGSDITFVAWGNAVSRCMRAALALEAAGFGADVIDLRSLSPWDTVLIEKSVRKTKRIIVVHEDNRTCGFGAEILARIGEDLAEQIQMARVVREDTFIPCNFENQLQVLPSARRILETSCELLGLEVTWEMPPAPEAGVHIVEAVGTSPADESVTITSWLKKPGDRITAGETIASYEADKAQSDLYVSVKGTVAEILCPEQKLVKVGTPLMRILLDVADIAPPKPVTIEKWATPRIRPREVPAAGPVLPVYGLPRENQRSAVRRVGIAGVATRLGSRKVDNAEILRGFPEKSDTDIVGTTGIASRQRCSADENAVSLGTDAAREILRHAELEPSDLDMIICSTGTPGIITPSLACRILFALCGSKGEVPAWDLSAACCGYIYALSAAWHFLQSKPEGKVLVITAETLSRMVNDRDYGTAIIFGDAATATVVYGEAFLDTCSVELLSPVLSSSAEPGKYLTVPAALADGAIFMDGPKVFTQAVRRMSGILGTACANVGMTPSQLDLVIPHQANQRIIDAIRTKNDLAEEKVYSNIRDLGNTSSSTIPICLAEILPGRPAGQRIGLVAFGGGFTFGAAILRTIERELPLVVCVDDEAENLFVFKRKFGREFNLQTFTDPHTALAFIKTNPFVRLVITDQVMPGMTGNELCDAVHMVKPQVRFVLITGNPENDDNLMYRSLRQNRFYEFFQKPVDFDGRREEYLSLMRSLIAGQ